MSNQNIEQLKAELMVTISSTKGVTKAIAKAKLETLLNVVDILEKDSLKVWRTANGELIPVSKLGDIHLLRIFNKCFSFRDSNHQFVYILEEICNRWGSYRLTIEDGAEAIGCETVGEVLNKIQSLGGNQPLWVSYAARTVYLVLLRHVSGKSW